MDWAGLPEGTFTTGAVGGLILGMLWFVAVCLLRAFHYIRRYGLWNYVKSALTIENDSLGLFLVLLTLLLVTVLFFRGGT